MNTDIMFSTFFIIVFIFMIFITFFIYRAVKTFRDSVNVSDLKTELTEKRIMDEIHQMEIRLMNQTNKSFSQLNEEQWKLKEEIILLDYKSTPPTQTVITARPRGRPPKSST